MCSKSDFYFLPLKDFDCFFLGNKSHNWSTCTNKCLFQKLFLLLISGQLV